MTTLIPDDATKTMSGARPVEIREALKTLVSAMNGRGEYSEGGCDYDTETGRAYRAARLLIEPN